MLIPLGDAARNLAEGRGYVIDKEYVASMISLVDRENKLVDIQDVPPPRDEQFTPYYALPPGTSMMLAGTYLAFGEYRYIYLRVIQAIIDSFGCLLMFLIGRELFGRKVGLIAAFLYAIYLPIAYLSTWPLHDALMPFITLVSLYFFIKAVRTRAIKFYILSAFFAGVGCYFQPSVLLLPLIFGLGLFIYKLRKLDFRRHVVNVVKVTAIMVAVLVLVISPWVARNYRVTGAFISMRPSMWQGVWEGFGEFDNPVGAVLDDGATYEQVKEELGYEIEYGTPEYDAVFMPKVLNAMREYPGWWLSVVARRVPLTIVYCSELGISNLSQIKADYPILLAYLYRNAPGAIGYKEALRGLAAGIKDGTFWGVAKDHPFGVIYFGMVGFFGVVPVLLSIVGVWVMRRNWRLLILVAAVPAYFSLVHMFVFVASYKSMVPGVLGYIIFSAVALYYIYNEIKGTTKKAVELAMPPN
jgi:4-amino-4-deoxy-L-arabinose transferase-like glycosyltransferase